MREIVSPLDGFLSPFGRIAGSGGAPEAYAIGGASPELVAAFLTASDGTTEGEYFRTGGVEDDFSMFTFSRSGLATMFDGNGALVWAPHNIAVYSDDASQWIALVGGTGSSPVVTANYGEAPNGEMIADRVQFNRGAIDASGSYSLLSFVRATYAHAGKQEIWVKSNTGSNQTFLAYNNDAVGAEYTATTAWQKVSIACTASSDRIAIIGTRGGSGSYFNGGDQTLDLLVAHVGGYHTNLGGMADNPDQPAGLEKYVPTTSAAVYLSRRNAYYYNGTAWTKGGLQLESAAATQLLHGTDSFATQTETVTAQAYTLQFRGTGSIALTGAHTATLNGTGANDLVSLTFTPSAGTLTLTPSGTVDYPQLEVGSIPTSYIPNTAGSGTVARAAETLSIAGADTPANTTAMSISINGLMTYADEGAAAQETFLRWYADANNFIALDLDTDSTATGEVNANQSTAGTLDTVVAAAEYSPGVNVAFNIASRHTSGAINVAKDGTAATADTTPTALVDLSGTALSPGYDFNGFISELRIWGKDIGNSGIAEVTS